MASIAVGVGHNQRGTEGGRGGSAGGGGRGRGGKKRRNRRKNQQPQQTQNGRPVGDLVDAGLEELEPRPPEAVKRPPLLAFFQGHSDFVYNPGEAATSEFRRLCQALSIQPGSQEWGRLNGEFADAMAMQFNEKYGTAMQDIGAWQILCLRIGIDPVPNDLEGARQAVYNADVNLVDLTDDNLEGLHRLSGRNRTDRVFPIGSSKAGDILTALLAVQMGADPSAFASPSSPQSVGSPFIGVEGEQKVYPEWVGAVVDHGDYEEVINREELLANQPSFVDQFQALNVAEAAQAGPGAHDVTGAKAHGAPSVQVGGAGIGGPSNARESPLAQFFAKVPEFDYQPSESATAEFRRLWKDHLKLNAKVTQERREKSRLFNDWSAAMVAEFAARYGSSMNDLHAWQSLCRRLELVPIPDGLEQARKAVLQTYVNAVDLIGEGPLVKFSTEKELKDYTTATFKKFPRNRLGKNDILRAILRCSDTSPAAGR